MAFNVPNISNEKLRAANVPKTLRGWQQFALTFNAYKHHGGFKACAAIANKRAPKTLTDYRTCLFFEQRRWRFLDSEPDASAKRYMRSLLEGIRKALSYVNIRIPRMNVITKPSLKLLKPALSKWIELNHLLIRRWQDAADVPWWYNERASVSLLAGAIWQTGKADDYAFEEYAIEKPLGKKPCNGRIDIEFSVRGEMFIAEAKQCWLEPHHVPRRAERVEQLIKQAVNDVLRCDNLGMRRLAIVFCVPAFKKSKVIDAEIAEFADFGTQVKSDACAWVFPRFDKLPDRRNGLFYPGTMVWLREVKV